MRDTSSDIRDLIFQLEVIPVGKLRRRDPPSVELPSSEPPGPRSAPTDRRARFFSLEGRSYSIAEWARLFGLKSSTVRARLRRGWSLVRALTQPPQKNPGELALFYQVRFYSVRTWAKKMGLSESGLQLAILL